MSRTNQAQRKYLIEKIISLYSKKENQRNKELAEKVASSREFIAANKKLTAAEDKVAEARAKLKYIYTTERDRLTKKYPNGVTFDSRYQDYHYLRVTPHVYNYVEDTRFHTSKTVSELYPGISDYVDRIMLAGADDLVGILEEAKKEFS